MPSNLIITREIPPLPTRSEDAHKGERGRGVVMGGSSRDIRMIGAPALAANTAYRGGAGLVRILTPESNINPTGVLSPCSTLAVLRDDPDAILKHVADYRADALAIGPGMGNELAAETIARVVNQSGLPTVLDADALNRIADCKIELEAPERIVLTPHHGELQRLLSAKGQQVELDRTFARRRDALQALYDCYHCISMLKGHRTLITNGSRLYVNETGNAGMATGGTGDVLTGLIAALLAQSVEPFEAAMLGVYLHGLAGDFAAEELGRPSMTAFDLIAYIPDSFREYESSATDLP
ncbi:MAG: NAD(P)H-hydrate dehydratase [Planctomycetota bacterium]|jgi:NAD(P)H-hydrate epimerase